MSGIEDSDTLPVDPGNAITVAGDSSGRGDDSIPPAGTTIGRFRVDGLLGRGGMGVVVAAYDPELDRRVAVKLVRAARWSSVGASQGRERLLREARAMARLSHPNVLTVHDVGAYGDGMFIATELVSGGTLRGWMEASRRSWREVRDRLLPAGRGLVAAHAAGLIHRDFKPDNVLITGDGQVRVADFGLVGSDGSPALPVVAPESSSSTLTQAGALLGTPAYMAPEQHRGERASTASDQYAFCVTFWEALHGVRPPDRPRDDVPVWLERILERGLAAHPEQRWPSLEALLGVLAADPDARRRRRIRAAATAAAAIAVVALSAALVIAGAGRDAAASPCTAEADRFAGVWDGPRREAVRTSFAASGRPHATDTFQRITRTLDAYVVAWGQARLAACEATHVHKEQSEPLLDRRMDCLGRRRQAVAALVELFATATDPAIVDRAVPAVAELPALAACAELVGLAAATPLPDDPVRRAEVSRVRDELAAIEALRTAGQLAPALEAGRALVASARAVDHAPVLAEVLEVVGRLEDLTAAFAEAEATLGEAVTVAAQTGDATLEAQAWIALIGVVGLSRGRLAEAEAMARAASAALGRAGRPAPIAAELLRVLGSLARSRGHFAGARILLGLALALAEEAYGRDHVAVARFASALGTAFSDSGDLDAARARLEEALAILEQALGPNHPELGASLLGLGNLLRNTGDYPGARARFLRGLAIVDGAFGAGSAASAPYLAGLGNIAASEGAFDDAAGWYQRAIEVVTATQGPGAPMLGGLINNLANVRLEAGRYAEALPLLREALSRKEARFGRDHPDVAWTLGNLSHALRLLGELAEAREVAERARVILETAYGPRHGWVAYPIEELAQIALAEGRARDGVELAERALALREAGPAEPREVAISRMVLAMARWELPDRKRALALARTAHAELVALEDPRATELATWLASRGQ